MNWPVTIGVIAGFVAGANLGVLLMVALRAGRRHDDAADTAALIARVQELERALADRAEAVPPGLGLVGGSQPGPAPGEPTDEAWPHSSPRAS